jgi:hypothetical protein
VRDCRSRGRGFPSTRLLQSFLPRIQRYPEISLR